MLTTVATVEEVHSLSSECCILDCRFSLMEPELGRSQYIEGHIPGAHYAHLDNDMSGEIVLGKSGRHPLPDREAFIKKLRARGISNRTQVITYDDSGGPFAARLWWLLKWIGHDAVAVLDGGLTAWRNAGLKLSAELPESACGKVTLRDSLVDEVGAGDILGNSAWLLLDAREGARYRGEAEPLDPVAGHIPGAINHPFHKNLDSNGQFHHPDQLQSIYSEILDNHTAEQIICYCGSGVTAAHNVLAMAHSRIGTPKLYAGSWSEWITDPDRPVGRSASPSS